MREYLGRATWAGVGELAQRVGTSVMRSDHIFEAHIYAFSYFSPLIEEDFAKEFL